MEFGNQSVKCGQGAQGARTTARAHRLCTITFVSGSRPSSSPPAHVAEFTSMFLARARARMCVYDNSFTRFTRFPIACAREPTHLASPDSSSQCIRQHRKQHRTLARGVRNGTLDRRHDRGGAGVVGHDRPSAHCTRGSVKHFWTQSSELLSVVEGGGGVVVFSVEVMLTGERVGDRADGRVSSR